MNNIVEIRHMSKRFGPTVALDDVSITARDGEILGLIGENGSGKSTATSIYAGMQKCDSGEMFQSTMYAGHGYGSRKADVEKILSEGKRVLTTMDICGVMSLKTYFKNVTTIYIKRNKKALMASILRKNSSIEDKVNRLMAIEYEQQNAELCDYVVDFDTYDDAVEQIRDIIHV